MVLIIKVVVRPPIKTSCNHIGKYLQISCRFLIFLFVTYQILITHIRSQFMVSAFHVSPTTSLSLSKRGSTKVFRVVKNDGGHHYSDICDHNCANIRSDIGLLTTTAGTFIQKGVTTKYATQFVGTTIDNGRTYAQYLKESSHILFDQNHNEPTIGTRWIGNNLQADICSNCVTQNHQKQPMKDLNINKPIELMKLNELGIWQNLANQTHITFNDFVELNGTKKMQQVNDIYEVTSSNTRKKKEDSIPADEHYNNIVYELYVKHKLPTYTINNKYEVTKLPKDSFQTNDFKNRNPKYIHRDTIYSSMFTQSSPQLATEKMSNFTSITYFGFADFTTMVGESVIIFSPSFDPKNRSQKIHATSISGEATLNEFNLKIFPSISDKPIEEVKHHPFVTTSKWQYKESTTTNHLLPMVSDTLVGVNQYPFQLLLIENNTSLESLIKPTTTTISNAIIINNTAAIGHTLPSINQQPYVITSEDLRKKLSALLTINNRNNKSFINPGPYKSNQSNIEILEGATTIFFEDNEDQLSNSGDFSNIITPIETSVISKNSNFEKKGNKNKFEFEKPSNDEFQKIDLNPNTNCSQAEIISNVLVEKHIQKKHICNQFTNKSFSMHPSNTNTLKSSENYLFYSESGKLQHFKMESGSEISQFIPKLKIENNLCENANIQNHCRNEDDEIEVIFKTLYTTHTYLFTYFDDNYTSFSSHTDIISNITSITLNNDSDNNYIPSILEYNKDNEIQTTSSKGYLLPTELELGKWKKTLIKPQVTTNFQETIDNQLYKTYYTIYMYYTTLHFGNNETKISSHTEIYTNLLESTKIKEDYSGVGYAGNNRINNGNNNIDVTVSLAGITSQPNYLAAVNKLIKNSTIDQHFSNGSNWQLWPNQLYPMIMEDLISLESNMDDEIIPSATLLLKTSFTTFTYYTTMYHGDKSSIISHLETITNTATETLNLLNARNSDEKIQPITYFTTYTYWTKLAKDNQITTWSSEKIISNVISPTNVVNAFNVLQTIDSLDKFINAKQYLNLKDTKNKTLQVTEDMDIDTSISPHILHNLSSLIKNSEMDKLLLETTFYTTYTYCTTSYETNETIVNSSINVQTNMITNIFSITPTTSSNIQLNLSTEAYQNSNHQTLTYAPTYDLKKIIDADGISTLYFTTQVISSLGSDGIITLLTTSTSNLYIDADKQILLSNTIFSSIRSHSDGQHQKSHKTGLVRIIEGTRINNNTTTYYRSKVIGTFIDKRYAQIIDSTSSLIFAKPTSLPNYSSLSIPSLNVNLENILLRTIQSTTITYEINTNSNQHWLSELSPTSDSLYLHISNIKSFPNNSESDNKSLELSTRSFTPIIRPFAARRRLPFIPKKNNLLPSSATIITRSSGTPTITATPALKSINRLSSLRRLGVQTSGSFSVRSSRFNKLLTSSSNTNFLGTLSIRLNSASTLTFRVNDSSNSRHSNSRFFSKTPISRVGLFSGGLSRITHLNGKFTPTNTVLELITKTKVNLEDKDTNIFTSINAKKESGNESIIKENNPSLRLQRSQLRRNSFTAASLLINPSSLYKKTSSNAPHRPILKIKRNLKTSARLGPVQTALNNFLPPRSIFDSQEKHTDLEIIAHTDINKNFRYSNDYSDDYVEDAIVETEAEKHHQKHSNNNNILINTPQKALNTLRKINIRKKRQSEGILKIKNNLRNRFRAPKASVITQTLSEANNAKLTKVASPTLRNGSNYGARFSNRQKPGNFSPPIRSTMMSALNSKAIRPTRLNLSGRSPFTLREKDANILTLHKGKAIRSSFRRPQLDIRANSGLSASASSESTENGNRRLKNDKPHNSVSVRSRNGQTINKYHSSRGRSKHRNNSNGHMGSPQLNLKTKKSVLLKNNGTITITKMIKATISVPIINGKITEYKSITTAKISTNIIEPNDYTIYTDNNGQSNLILNKEDTIINSMGTTEIIQYVLHATPTTTVIFTPTTIRGRKTSFSHVLPSTAYSVEEVTSTIQPQVTANAPLANILLSQLLLGNVRVPENAPINAFSQSSLPNIVFPQKQSLEPVTEYKTRKSTYVTTLYKGESTVLPVTFQGKKIFTTVYDTTAETITATEFITDTIINTPSPIATNQVQPLLSSLLLQRLQHQLLLQQPLIQNPTELHGIVNLKLLADSISSQLYFSNNNLQESEILRNLHEIHENNGGILTQPLVDIIDMDLELKTQNLKPQSIQTSIVTLYVSGRRPGQFSTVLSTIEIQPQTTTIYKRHAIADNHLNESYIVPNQYVLNEYSNGHSVTLVGNEISNIIL